MNKYTTRSHNCGEPNRSHEGQRVTLQGWLTFRRMKGKFFVIRDAYGATQAIISSEVIMFLFFAVDGNYKDIGIIFCFINCSVHSSGK